MRFILPLMAVSLVGCIVYDEQLLDSEGNPIDTPDDLPIDRPDSPTAPSDPEPEPDPPSEVDLDPDSAEPGQAVIVAITADGGLDQIEQIQFFGPGDLTIVAISERGPEEFLVTLEVADDSPTGANDLLLELQDGSAIFVEDAFRVL